MDNKPKDIKKPILAASAFIFIFIHLAKFFAKDTKRHAFITGFTQDVNPAIVEINKLYRKLFNVQKKQHVEAVKEISNYYYNVVALANQAENMDDMIKAMEKYLENEKFKNK
jgi:hypothetical protein